jgi:sucrose-6-phosphate hydrolase SacC (GH32 family)
MGEKAFVMSYFRTKKEALHIAISKDGYNWKAIRKNRPILSSHLRTRTMRDPFLFRDREGLFHLFTTDGWTSRYIIHARSDDLLNWMDMKALPVMTDIPGALNSWAPESFYDSRQNVYRLIWSSTVSSKNNREEKDHRIWSAETEDFSNYSTSSLFFDPGYNVIDATMCRDGNTYVMAFKDERGTNIRNTPYKAIRICSSTGDCFSFTGISDIITSPLTEGPILFRCHERWMLFYDHYMDGHWGASISVDLENWVNITKGVKFPNGPRHGSVIEVEEELYRRLERHL